MHLELMVKFFYKKKKWCQISKQIVTTSVMVSTKTSKILRIIIISISYLSKSHMNLENTMKITNISIKVHNMKIIEVSYDQLKISMLRVSLMN